MSRLATWRRGPNDPITLRGWLFSSVATPSTTSPVTSEGQPKRGLLKRLGWGALAITMVVVARFPHILHYIDLSLALTPIAIERLRRFRQRRASIAFEGPEEGVWTAVSLFDRSGACTGTDYGWLIHCEGWLLFGGGRTSFAFSRGEARPLRYSGRARVRLEDGRDVEFVMPGERPDWAPLERLVADWNGAPIPEGEAVLPPKGAHPEIWVTWWNFSLIAMLASLGVAAMAIFFEAPRWAALIVIASVGCGLGAAYCASELNRGLRGYGLLPNSGALDRTAGAESPLPASVSPARATEPS